MPKIVAGGSPLAAHTPGVAGAELFTSSSSSSASRGSRSERLVGFDEVLSTARGRTPEPERTQAAPEAERSAAEVASKPKAKPAKPKRRESAPEPSEAEAPVDETAPAAKSKPATGPSGEAAEAREQVGDDGEPVAKPSAEGIVDEHAGDETIVGETPVVLDAQTVSVTPAAASTSEVAVVSEGDSPDAASADPAQSTTDDALPDAIAARSGTVVEGTSQTTSVSAIDVASMSTTEATDGDSVVEETTASFAPVTVSAPAAPAATTTHSAPDADTLDGQPTTVPNLPHVRASASANAPAEVVDATPEELDASAQTPHAAPSHGSLPDVTAATTTSAAPAVDVPTAQLQPKPALAPGAPAPQSQPLAPEAQFADDNHPSIVAGIRGQLMPTGGTMQIRLDPPELGPLAVTINIRDGVVEASFETSSDAAAKLLSHSLSTLKTSLESQGVNVERLNVHQAPKSNEPGNNGSGDRDQQQNQARDPQQEQAAQREQQRREMLRRMWRKLSGIEDPLDMVA